MIFFEVFDIFDEVCEDKVNFYVFIQMKLVLFYFGDKGLFFFLRFFFILKGFFYLNERGYVVK